MSEDKDRMRAVEGAMGLRDEVHRFEKIWPALPTGTPLPPFTWEALERQLTDMAANDRSAALVSGMVSATRKLAVWKPPELVLREILCLASTLMDRDFPSSAEGGDTMS